MKYLLTASALSLAVAGAMPAFAADAADSAPVGDEEIIVTGEKAARSLQETTASVVVTTAARIENENLQTLQDVLSRTANVAETYGSQGFTIRGIANRGVSGAGDAPLTTIYIDGAAMPDQLVGFGPTDLWDMAQVEIFRGPQSTLQGLNALAGAIVMRSQDPTMEWHGRARASYARYDTTSFAGAVGGPLIPDELAFRVAAEKRDSDGSIYNVTRQSGDNAVDSAMLRGILLWTPSALPGFTARASYSHFDRKGGYSFTYADTDVPDFHEERIATANDPNDSDTRAEMATLELTYDIGSGLSLSSVTSFSDTDLLRRYDGDTTSAPLSYGENPYQADTWTQELRLNYESDWLSGLVGAYYYNRDQQSGSYSLTLVPTPVDVATALLVQQGIPTDLAQQVVGLYAQALPSIPVRYDATYGAKVETYAIFADGRVRIADRLTGLAGFRWDHEKNRTASEQTAVFAGIFPDPAAYGELAPLIAGLNAGVQGLVDEAGGGGAATPPSRRTFNAFLPKFGLEMAWTPDLSTSAVVQRGYRSGGTSINMARASVFAYDPEYTWNYELSLRSQWLDGQLTVNANAFYIDWKDQQVSANFGLNTYDFHTVNAGKSHLYGFEVETSYRPVPALQLYASLGHVRTKFDEFTTTEGTATDLSGLEFAFAPKFTLTGGIDWESHWGLKVNVNANYRSAVSTEVSRPQAETRVGARTIVNAKIGYDWNGLGLSVFANNLFDEQYVQYRYVEAHRAILGEPQVFGVLAEYSF